jgi:hypothetical protein
MQQYVTGNPTPWRVKICALCGKSGFAYGSFIYHEKTTGLNDDSERIWSRSISGDALMQSDLQRT